MSKTTEQTKSKNLRKYRKWLSVNAVASVIRGFLPTFLDDQSKRIDVVVNDGMRSYTDGKCITLSLLSSMLADQYVEEDWMLFLKAIAAHEAQHVNSSNLDDMDEIGKWYGKYLADNFGLNPNAGVSVAKDFLNIVEDGRIERIAVARRPGMFLPFMYMNQVIRGEGELKKQAENPANEFADFRNCCLCYAKTGLYSPNIQVYAGTRLESEFLKIQHWIDEGIESRTSSGCRKTVQNLLTDAAPYIAELIQSSPNLNNSLAGQEFQPEYTSNQGTEDDTQKGGTGGNPLRSQSPNKSPAGSGSQQDSSDESGEQDSKNENGSSGGSESKDSKGGKDSKDSDDKGSGNGKGKGSDKNKDGDGGSGGNGSKDSKDGDDSKNNADNADGSKSSGCDRNAKASDNNSDNTPEPGSNGKIKAGFENANSEIPPMSKSALDELRDAVSRDLENANAGARREREKNSRSQSDGLDKKEIESIRAEYTGKTAPINQKTLAIKGTEEISPEMKAQALMLRREIIRIQDSRNRSQKALRRGTLDQGALWKTGLQDARVFARKGQPDKGSVAFYLLIDNSGSMGGTAYRANNQLVWKYQAARCAAAVIEDASRNLVPCKIALFDQSGGSVNHVTVKEFDEKGGANRSWNSLSELGPGGCNADSVNIRIAAAELMHRPERKKVLCVLSDGAPSAYGSMAEGYTEVTEAVTSTRRKGVIVIPIMFGGSDFLQSNKSIYEVMYEKDIIASHPREISTRLSALFRLILSR